MENLHLISDIKAVLFDFDGTLTRPGLIDFAAIKEAMQCPRNMTILEYLDEQPKGERLDGYRKILESFETAAAEKAEPNTGAEDVLVSLRGAGIMAGILTRNSRQSVLIALKNFKRVRESEFGIIVSRDDVAAPKPDPEGVLLAAAQMNVPAENMLMVGDYHFDIEAGRRAGAITVFLDNGAEPPRPARADFRISELNELRDMLRII